MLSKSIEHKYCDNVSYQSIVKSKLECYVNHMSILDAGNVTSSEATSLMQYIEKTLSPLVNNRAPNFSQSLQRRIMCLEAGTEWFYPTAGFSPDDENSAISIFFQVLGIYLNVPSFHYKTYCFACLVTLSVWDPLQLNREILQVERDSPRSNMLLKLFTLIAQEQYFNQLRTVEQLGYIVNLYEKWAAVFKLA